MTVISEIKNDRLARLLGDSKKFKLLSEDQQGKHIKSLAALANDKQEEACRLLERENKKEKAKTQKKMKILKKLYAQVVKLEANFKKLLKADPETKASEGEKKDMEKLLSKLNKT